MSDETTKGGEMSVQEKVGTEARRFRGTWVHLETESRSDVPRHDHRSDVDTNRNSKSDFYDRSYFWFRIHLIGTMFAFLFRFGFMVIIVFRFRSSEIDMRGTCWVLYRDGMTLVEFGVRCLGSWSRSDVFDKSDGSWSYHIDIAVVVMSSQTCHHRQKVGCLEHDWFSIRWGPDSKSWDEHSFVREQMIVAGSEVWRLLDGIVEDAFMLARL